MTKPLALFSVMALLHFFTAAFVLAAPNDEEEVRNLVASFATAWNHHDMDAFGKLFAPDADFVNVAAIRWKGRQAIQVHHAYSHGTIPADAPGFSDQERTHYGIFRTSTLRFTQIEVRFLRQDVAVVHASSELLGDARTPDPRRTLVTFVLTRQNGGWLIAAAQNTEMNRTVK
jgi:ketosteroid isomerase-like protein